MLESKMDPDAICSVIDFCNNAEYKRIVMDQSKQKMMPFTCGQCQHIGGIIEQKFSKAEQDDVLENMLGVCGELSSYSDSCSSVVLKNFDDIYKGLRKIVNKEHLCTLSASCPNLSSNRGGIVDIIPSNDYTDPSIPCQLCEQMALHLQELLTLNTTDIEFKNMMIGFCHQMGKFSDECVELADEYYLTVYNALVDGLNASKMCKVIGICPAQLSESKIQLPTMPIVSDDVFPKKNQLFDDSSLTLHKNGSWCTSCNYLVHFMQEALRQQSTEDDVENFMKKICGKFPEKFRGECKGIVDLYGDTMFSFFEQEMNPRYICPLIKMCPPNLNINDLAKTAVDDKPTCPFCLLALQEVQEMIESNKTKEKIESVLGRLCNHLNGKLKDQCTAFVKQYTDEVVEMLMADLTPQEACSYLKLCNGNQVAIISEMDNDFDDEVEPKELLDNPQCELCKEIIKIVEQRVMNTKSKDEIRRELEMVCGRLNKFADKCVAFVDKYSDRIVDLIEKELEPQEVCRELTFCVAKDNFELQDYDVSLDIFMSGWSKPAEEILTAPQCVMCEFVMSKLETELNDTKVDANIKNTLRTICSHLPSTVGRSCKQFIDYYFDMIIVLIETIPPSDICAEIKLCHVQSYDESVVRQMVESIQHDVFKCAMCKGVVESIDTIIEDPQADTNLMNFEEKICEKFAGQYKYKVSDKSAVPLHGDH